MKQNLNKIIAAINKKYGEGTIVLGKVASLLNTQRIRTGIVALDLILGGGLPTSSILEFFGRESGGKTSTALKIIANFQKLGKTCAFIDMEHSFNAEWATTLGVNVDNLLISQPESLEESIDVIDALTRSKDVDLIVYDSIAAAVPIEEVEKSAEDQQMALQARLFSKMCRKLNSALQTTNLENKESYNNTIIILINQVREKVGQLYARGYETPGGHNIKHTAKIRIEFKKKDYLYDKQNKEDPIGVDIIFRTVKNKTWVPYKTGTFKLYFDGSVDNTETIIFEAKKLGLIKQSGPMYEYEDIKEKGMESFIGVLKEKNLIDVITDKVYNLIKGG